MFLGKPWVSKKTQIQVPKMSRIDLNNGLYKMLANKKLFISKMKCVWFSPVQIFVSDEVFDFHLSDLVVVQAQLRDGGWKVWKIQFAPKIVWSVVDKKTIKSIISTDISLYVSFSCWVEVQYTKTIGGWLKDKEKLTLICLNQYNMRRVLFYLLVQRLVLPLLYRHTGLTSR